MPAICWVSDSQNVKSQVTNDMSALLRAERSVIKRISDIRSAVPALEEASANRGALRERESAILGELEGVDGKLGALKGEVDNLQAKAEMAKRDEAAARGAFERKNAERAVLKGRVDGLRADMRSELAERNKQRERYRYLVAQEQEAALVRSIEESERQNPRSATNEGSQSLSDSVAARALMSDAVAAARMAKEEAEAHARMLQVRNPCFAVSPSM
jgi:chromosome segregation ATPase